MRFIEEVYSKLLHVRKHEAIDAADLLSKILREEIEKMENQEYRTGSDVVNKIIKASNEIYSRRGSANYILINTEYGKK